MRRPTLAQIAIPHLQSYKVAHLVAIASEMHAFMDPVLAEHGSSLMTSTQLLFALFSAFTINDLLQSAKLRRLAIQGRRPLSSPTPPAGVCARVTAPGQTCERCSSAAT